MENQIVKASDRVENSRPRGSLSVSDSSTIGRTNTNQWNYCFRFRGWNSSSFPGVESIYLGVIAFLVFLLLRISNPRDLSRGPFRFQNWFARPRFIRRQFYRIIYKKKCSVKYHNELNGMFRIHWAFHRIFQSQ